MFYLSLFTPWIKPVYSPQLGLANSLFGPGRARSDLQGRLDWEGERVRVQYYEKGVPPVLCLLEVYSKPLVAEQQAKLRAQRQWETLLDKL